MGLENQKLNFNWASCDIPREQNHHFSGKLTWPAAKGWPMEIISTYIKEHNPGGKHCLQGKIQDGRDKYLIHITF